MDIREFRARISEGTLSRREISRVLAGAGVGVGLMPMMSQSAKAEPDLTIFEWSGYELPQFHPEYAEKYGGEPQYAFFAEEEAAFQKIRAGFKVDLSHPCTASISRWRDAGLIKPIDTSRVSRWNDIIPDLFGAKGVMHEGQPYFMPWDFGWSQVVYNPEVISLENPNFDVLIDERYAGKVSMNIQVDVAVAVGGVIAGNENIFDPTDAEIEALREVWEKMVKTSRFLWSDGTEIAQAVASGEVGAAYMWTSDLVSLREQGIPLEVIPPVLPWICGLCVHYDAPGSEEQAYAYLDAMLDPVGGKALVEEYGYAHSNRKTYDLVDNETLNAFGLDDPVSVLSGGIFFDEIPPATREKLINVWEEVQAGV